MASIEKEHFMKIPMQRSLVILLFAGLFLTRTARAHDGWIEVSPIVEKGQPATISLMLGNHSNEHRSYRLAGKWDAKLTRLMVIEPSGSLTDITNSLVDLGEDDEKTGPKGPKGFHIATFTPKAQGVHIVLAREEQIQQHDGPKFRSIRSARTAFGAFGNPRLMEAKNVAGFDRTFAIENLLEIVPISNPLGVTEGSPVTLEVLYKGKPFPNQTVAVVRRLEGPASAQEFITNEKGTIGFKAGPPDFYLVRLKFDERGERSEGRFDLSSYQATYVFKVFNRP
jgi:hypothetical protein